MALLRQTDGMVPLGTHVLGLEAKMRMLRGIWTPDFVGSTGREAGINGRPEGRAGGWVKPWNMLQEVS